ncbi:MAG: delta-60 repeat domain-containing protein, partial [Verrucomicrobia bacterium]|nr:delta-60 repeat domain-containing protein [Verrucomicrobiota bacterium]
GKVIVGGVFTSVNQVNRNRLVRLNANGSLDTAFDVGSGANNTVYALLFEPDGDILVGGAFTEVSGLSRRGVARLRGDPPRLTIRQDRGQISVTSDWALNSLCELQVSTNLAGINAWQTLTNCGSGMITNYLESVSPGADRRFFRVRRVGP